MKIGQFWGIFCYLALSAADRPYYEDETKHINGLLKEYKATARPILKANDSVVVKLFPEIIRVEGIDEGSDTLSVSISLAQTWNDPRLKWNLSETSNIQKIHLPLDQLWKPDIRLYNVAPGGNTEIEEFPVVVLSNGDVIYVPFTTLNSYCQLDLRNFPFDVQECSLILGSWVFHAGEVELKFWGYENDTAVDVPLVSSDMGPGEHPTWSLVDKKAKGVIHSVKYDCCPNEPYQNLKITLKLQRSRQFFNYMLVVPGIILGLLVPLQFLLPPSSTHRSLFGMIIILCTTILVTGLSRYFPYEHSSVPKIGVFFVASMTIAAVAVFVSTIIAGIAGKGKNRRAMPAWVSQLCLGSKGLRRLLCISGTSPVNSMYSSVSNRLLEDMQEPALELPEQDLDQDQASSMKEMYNTTTEAYLRNIAKSTKLTAGKYVAEESLERLNAEWQDVAIVLDRMCFFIFMVLYIIIILSLVSNN